MTNKDYITQLQRIYNLAMASNDSRTAYDTLHELRSIGLFSDPEGAISTDKQESPKE